MPDKHLSPLESRLLEEESISPHQKVFALRAALRMDPERQVTPHLRFEALHRLLPDTEPHQFIQHYDVLAGKVEPDPGVQCAA